MTWVMVLVTFTAVSAAHPHWPHLIIDDGLFHSVEQCRAHIINPRDKYGDGCVRLDQLPAFVSKVWRDAR